MARRPQDPGADPHSDVRKERVKAWSEFLNRVAVNLVVFAILTPVSTFVLGDHLTAPPRWILYLTTAGLFLTGIGLHLLALYELRRLE